MNNNLDEINITLDSATATLDELQSQVLDKGVNTTEQAIEAMLATNEGRPFGINRNNLSVVRRKYGTGELRVIANRGFVLEKHQEELLGSSLSTIVKAIIDDRLGSLLSSDELEIEIKNEIKMNVERAGKGSSYFITERSSQLIQSSSLLKGYSSVVIVPMRLYADKSIGVFIVGKESELISHNTAKYIDSFSDRFALILRFLDKKHREKLQNSLNQTLARKKATRVEMVETCIDFLTKDLSEINADKFPYSTQKWFNKSEIDIITRHPNDFKKFYWVYGGGSVKHDNENRGELIELKDLTLIAGNATTLVKKYNYPMPTVLKEVFDSKAPKICSYNDECKKYFPNDEKIKSFAVFPMLIPEGVIGYFIFKNYHEIKSYESELAMIDDISNTFALYLVQLRHQERQQSLDKFEEIFHKKSLANLDRDEYVELFVKQLKYIYGDEINFSLLLRDRRSGGMEVLEQSNSFYEDFLDKKSGENRTKELAKIFTLSQFDDDASYTKDFLDKYNEKNEEKILLQSKKERDNNKIGLKRSVIIPLHRMVGGNAGMNNNKEEVNIGCLVVKNFHMGRDDLEFLDRLTNQLAKQIHHLTDDKRQQLLFEFEKEIREKSEISQEEVLKKTRLKIDSVMNTENMFIALLDDNKITFPIFQVNGEPREDVAKKAQRLYKPNAEKRPRVEWILDEKEKIFIETIEESREWYRANGDKEAVGNPYASWVGVPIWEEREVIGVMAIFHPFEDYIYDAGDVGFIESLSEKISLFLQGSKRMWENVQREVEKEKEKEQSKQQEAIIEETRISNEILLNYFSSSIKSSLDFTKAQVGQAIYDIDEVLRTEDIELLNYTLDGLQKSRGALIDGVKDFDLITSSAPSTFNLFSVVAKVVRDINRQNAEPISDKLSVKDSKSLKSDFLIISNYQVVLNTIYRVLKLTSRMNEGITSITLSKVNDCVEVRLAALDGASLIVDETALDRFKKNLDGLVEKVERRSGQLVLEFYIDTKSSSDRKNIYIMDDESGSLFHRWLRKMDGDYHLTIYMKTTDEIEVENHSVCLIGGSFVYMDNLPFNDTIDVLVMKNDSRHELDSTLSKFTSIEKIDDNDNFITQSVFKEKFTNFINSDHSE